MHKKTERVSAATEWVFDVSQQVNKKSFKHFPWYDVFTLYILRFFMTNTFLRLEAISVQEQEKTPNPERGAILEVTVHMN